MSERGDIHQVGSAKVDITPPIGIHLAGFASRTNPSDGVYHPLNASAVVIDDGHTAVMLVSIEWLGFYDHAEPVRRLITQRIAIDPANIILTGTHTHCGPAFREIDSRRSGGLDEAYIATALQRVADCAVSAWHERAPARLRVGTGTCDIAASRRHPNSQGGVDWLPSLDAPHDHEVTVIAIDDLDGEPRQVIVSYACHPTCNDVTKIGGDYVGFAMSAIEARQPGVTAMFLQGCAGDQKVNTSDAQNKAFRKLSIDEVRTVGQRLADAAVNTLAGNMTPITGPMVMRQHRIELHTEPVDSALAQKHLADDDFMGDWARHMRAAHSGDGLRTSTVPFEIQTLAFGHSFAVVAMAGEMVVEYALRLKRELRHTFTHCLPIGYANDIVGYVPVLRQKTEGGYEVTGSNFWYLRTGAFVDETEDKIVSTALASLSATDDHRA